MRKLYHFTSRDHLHGISRFGLTIGDVPTDIHRWEGRCGIWLTSDSSARGHGLEGSSVDKSRYRLTVNVREGGSGARQMDRVGSEERHPRHRLRVTRDRG